MTSTLGTQSTTALSMEVGKRCTLDIAHVADGDHHRIIGIEVLGVELMIEGDNLCLALIAILFLHLQQVFLHHLLATLRIIQDFLQVSNEFHQVVVLLVQLIDTQAGQLAQTHIYDSLRLQLVEFEALLQVTLGVGRCSRLTDDVYHLVDIVHGNDQALQDVGTLLRLLQVELRATDSHLMTVFDEIADAFTQRKKLRTHFSMSAGNGHQGDIVHRERALQGSHLEQFVQNHVSIGIALYVNHDTHTLTT